VNHILTQLQIAHWLTDGFAKHYGSSVIISEMVHLFADNKTKLLFIKTFFDTLSAAWLKLDKHRVGKYMGLIRRMVEQSFVLLNNNEYEENLVNSFIDILKSGPLDVNNRLNSSFLCVITKYVYTAMKGAYENLNEDIFLKFIDLYFHIYSETYETEVLKSIESNLFQHMVHEGDFDYWKQFEESNKHPDEDSDDEADSDDEEEEDDSELVQFPMNYKLLSDKMDQLHRAPSTENKKECLHWKTLFYNRHAQEANPEDVLDELEQEMSDIQQMKNVKQQQKQQRQEKKQTKRLSKMQQMEEAEDEEEEDDGDFVFTNGDHDEESDDEEEEAELPPMKPTRRTQNTKFGPEKKQAINGGSKKVQIDLDQNLTKTFMKDDLVLASPLPTQSPKKGLLKRKLKGDVVVPPFNDYVSKPPAPSTTPARQLFTTPPATTTSNNKRKRNPMKAALQNAKKRKLQKSA
jgi:hypothetical protein